MVNAICAWLVAQSAQARFVSSVSQTSQWLMERANNAAKL